MSSRGRVDRRKFHWRGSTDRLGIDRTRTSDGNFGLDSDVASGVRLSSWFPVCTFETLRYSRGGKREGQTRRSGSGGERRSWSVESLSEVRNGGGSRSWSVRNLREVQNELSGHGYRGFGALLGLGGIYQRWRRCNLVDRGNNIRLSHGLRAGMGRSGSAGGFASGFAGHATHHGDTAGMVPGGWHVFLIVMEVRYLEGGGEAVVVGICG